MLALSRGARSHRGIVSRPAKPYQCPGLPEPRFRSLQVLIRDIHLFFQGIQLWVLKNLPPLTPRYLIAGCSRLPVWRNLLEARRGGRRGLGIARAYRAAAKQK